MASRALTMPGRMTAKSKAPQRKSSTISAALFDRMTVIQQIRRSFMPGARLAAFTGLGIGGFVPVATYTVAHYEVQAAPALWVLVAGGLIYSALTVFSWAASAFGSKGKALGFCVLLEGVLTFGTIPALSLAALAVLIFINAVSAACALQVRKDHATTAARRPASVSILAANWGD